jgi:4-alpha-glucanotransferase
VRELKNRALRTAFRSFLDLQWKRRTPRARQLEEYAREHAKWLDDYTLFVTLHDAFKGKPWTEWEPALRDREPAALAAARARYSEQILYQAWLQWQLDVQWHAARRACNAAGVELMGDVPFMVGTDSADVWARPFDFRLDARVGVPPDQYSATGQDWGLPVYRWFDMEKNGFVWMNERARRSADLYGLFRVDHVIGLYRTYYRDNATNNAAFIPENEAAQVRNGETMLKIFSQGARVIAEDLGVVPDFARTSLNRVGVPGYRVLRWEKEWERGGHSFRDPSHWPALSVATTGTHDSEMTAEWYDSIPDWERDQFLNLAGMARIRERGLRRFDNDVRDGILEMIYRSGSDLLLVPFQDVMGTRERINVPGTVTDTNWTYRMSMTVTALANDLGNTERLRSLSARSGRLTL